MFGDLMGNMEERQKELKSKLAEIIVEAEAGDGAIKVTANANREIINISINKEALDWDDQEQIEDLMVVAVNRALEKAIEKEAIESERLIKDMMPPGFGGLSDLFG
jgi:DNA-binding YbaB/EbfC family protein